MKILISNDDGIHADGIAALSKELCKKHEVYIVAPDRERSAAGHSLTLHTPLRVEEIEPRYGSKRSWTTNGTPGDCVKIAINAILDDNEKPDIVITGINHGPNLGSDILYSGTVSCAMEGAVMGYPSLAVSLCSMGYDLHSFDYTAKFVSKFLPKIKEIKFPKRTILNINVPGVAEEDINGIAITTLGTRMFTDEYEKRVDPRGKAYYWMAGELIKESKNDKTDINAVRWNKISITPITFDMTHKSIIPSLEKAFCKDGKCDWL
ncbi:5'/3'-nucleotidase SurE [bacterium]|nr:5'/3'-nucleotidase SurE [bacterium]